MQKNISILGSTGSIGTNTLDVVRSHPDRFRVVALACGKNLSLLKEQIEEFKPLLVSIADVQEAQVFREVFRDGKVEIVSGEEGCIQVATHPTSDLVVSAIVGAAGLVAALRALEAQKNVALANKEAMVIAGMLMNQAAEKAGVKIFPVDSEHSAIFQCLEGHASREVKRLILTASGGPFLNSSYAELQAVSPSQALKHPNWSMGSKITIDSATLMNKGLELIEAYWLFQIPENQIDVCVHPQSVIHSMVEYQDGSVIAQLGIADMRIPIAYALSYPDRLTNTLPSLDLFKIKTLNFFEPDLHRFECLPLARESLKKGGDAPCVLNAANEIAVQAFLQEEITFLEISYLIKRVLSWHQAQSVHSLDQLLQTDRWARDQALKVVEELKSHSLSSVKRSVL